MKTFPLLEEHFGSPEKAKKKPEYASAYRFLASYYHSIGKFNEAIEYFHKSIDILAKTVGEQYSHYIEVMNDMATCYADIS